MEVKYSDVVCTGFSTSEGSPGESESHINGENGDFRFLRSDKSGGSLNIRSAPDDLDEVRQAEFNEAMYKFGWKQMLAWQYTRGGVSKLLPRTIHYPLHDDHLHLGRYQPNIKDKVDEG
jgi:hypothetical protein